MRLGAGLGEPAGPRPSWGGSGAAGRRSRGRVGFCGHTMRILLTLSLLALCRCACGLLELGWKLAHACR